MLSIVGIIGGIISMIISLIVVFRIVNPFLRNRGFVLLFRIIIGLVAYVCTNFVIQLIIGLGLGLLFKIF